MTDPGKCKRCHGRTPSPQHLWCERCARELEREYKADPEYRRQRDEYLADIDDDDYEPLDMVPR